MRTVEGMPTQRNKRTETKVGGDNVTHLDRCYRYIEQFYSPFGAVAKLVNDETQEFINVRAFGDLVNGKVPEEIRHVIKSTKYGFEFIIEYEGLQTYNMFRPISVPYPDSSYVKVSSPEPKFTEDWLETKRQKNTLIHFISFYEGWMDIYRVGIGYLADVMGESGFSSSRGNENRLNFYIKPGSYLAWNRTKLKGLISPIPERVIDLYISKVNERFTR